MAYERRRYENPPLIEAVVEFQFQQDPEWDSTLLGLIRAKLADFPRVETLHGATLLVDTDRVGVQQAPEGKRFWRSDGAAAVTVMPNIVAVSVLPPKLPEPHAWSMLRDLAFQALEVYRTVGGERVVVQSSVKYINSILINPEEFRSSDWLADDSGLVPKVVMDERNPFNVRLERVVDVAADHVSREVVVIAAEPQPSGEGRLLLDVDEVTRWTAPPDLSGLKRVSEYMHDAVHNVFGKVLHPAVLDTFGPIQSTSSQR